MTAITPAAYRANLERERDEILNVLDSGEQYARRHLAKRLREIVGELADIDAGQSWINSRETKPRIRLDDMSAKVLKT
jgi:hypothetical protein